MSAEIIDVEPIEEHSGLVPMAHTAAVEAAVTPQKAIELQNAYVALCHALLTPDDYQEIRTRQGKRTFKKKSAWRKLAVAFNVSTELLKSDVVTEDGAVQMATMVVRATAPNGRYMDGIGICARNEREFSKPEHDIPATAMTRATNRACADLFGLGEVSAEEMTSERPAPAEGPASDDYTPMPSGVKERVQPPSKDGKMATDKQVNYMSALLKGQGLSNDEQLQEIHVFAPNLDPKPGDDPKEWLKKMTLGQIGQAITEAKNA